MRPIAFLFGILLLISCQSQAEKDGDNMSALEANTGNPVIQFDTTSHDFGTLIEGEIVSYTFKFYNNGDGPLLIKSASASCGCTVPGYSKEPTPPGDEGKVVVEFNTRGKLGTNHKTISIRSNSNPPVTILNIFAEVVRAEQ